MLSWYCGKSHDTTYLMIGHKGKSEFCFLEIVNIPGGKARRILGLMREKFLCASIPMQGPPMKCFVIPPNLKMEQLVI